MAFAAPDAVVVLGCRLRWSQESGLRQLLGAGGRRVESAVRLVRELEEDGSRPRVLASGGRSWAGVIEADALAEELARLAVPLHRIERERRSRSTKENARLVATCVPSGARIAVVTCDWHLSRAVALFRAQGFEVQPVSAPSGHVSWARRVWRWGRERVAATLDGL